ncbi:MAG: hypothetical protein II893_04615 [Methanomicrobium sp.]|nr:hypothetical protein [Methanomicrobium sp.]
MNTKRMAAVGLTLIAVLGTALSCGCVGAQGDNIRSDTAAGNITNPVSPLSISLHDASEELAFMKDMLSEMRMQGKDVSSLNAIYWDAKEYYKQDKMAEFEQSLNSFYAKCRDLSMSHKEVTAKALSNDTIPDPEAVGYV